MGSMDPLVAKPKWHNDIRLVHNLKRHIIFVAPFHPFTDSEILIDLESFFEASPHLCHRMVDPSTTLGSTRKNIQNLESFNSLLPNSKPTII